MELRCPNCGSTELRKVSLAYEEGRFYVRSRTRLRALLFGADGPDFAVGRAHTVGILEAGLSKRLQPPVKWSYLKLVGWLALGSVAALIAHVQWVMSSSERVSSLSVAIFAFSTLSLFLLSVFLFWRHNRFVYPRKRVEWEQSFLCRRCGSRSHKEARVVDD
jgi:hypothetical protein